MEKKLSSVRLAELASQVVLETESLNLKNKELIKENNCLKDINFKLSDKLKTKEKQLEKYKSILNITPGTIDNKVELLEHYVSIIVPILCEKAGSKYTSKIMEYLESVIIEDNELEDIPRYKMVEGTVMEFLSPYLRLGYIEMDRKEIRGYIENPRTFNYKEMEYMIFAKNNLVCPMPTDKEAGIFNYRTFNKNCVDDLYLYLSKNSFKFREYEKGICINIRVSKIHNEGYIYGTGNKKNFRRDLLIGYFSSLSR